MRTPTYFHASSNSPPKEGTGEVPLLGLEVGYYQSLLQKPSQEGPCWKIKVLRSKKREFWALLRSFWLSMCYMERMEEGHFFSQIILRFASKRVMICVILQSNLMQNAQWFEANGRLIWYKTHVKKLRMRRQRDRKVNKTWISIAFVFYLVHSKYAFF